MLILGDEANPPLDMNKEELTKIIDQKFFKLCSMCRQRPVINEDSSPAQTEEQSDSEFLISSGETGWIDLDSLGVFEPGTKFKCKEDIIRAIFYNRVYSRIMKEREKLVEIGLIKLDSKGRAVSSFTDYPSWKESIQQWYRFADRRKRFSWFRKRGGKNPRRKVYFCPGQVDGTSCATKDYTDIYFSHRERILFVLWRFDHVKRVQIILEAAEKVLKSGKKLDRNSVVFYLASPKNIVCRCFDCDRLGTKKHNDEEDKEFLIKEFTIEKKVSNNNNNK